MTNDQSLSAEAITRDLRTHILGRRVVYYARIGSTNDAARELANAGEPEGTLVIADEQTTGRGRLGRTWVAPAHSSLLMSLLLRPNRLTPTQINRVTMAVSLGMCDAIRVTTGLNARIKWPNDILLDGKKCAGVLAESGIVGDTLEYVIVGLGLNVNFNSATIEGIPPDATTIANELGKTFPRAPLAQAILQSIEKYYLRLRDGEQLHHAWAAQLATLKQVVRAQTPWGIEEGIAEDVDENGALLLRRADQTTVRLVAGDVTLRA